MVFFLLSLFVVVVKINKSIKKKIKKKKLREILLPVTEYGFLPGTAPFRAVQWCPKKEKKSTLSPLQYVYTTKTLMKGPNGDQNLFSPNNINL